MKEQIEKLIKDYQEKITNCDKMLEMFKQQIAKARREHQTTEYYRSERKHFNAQRQCYIQFISDLEDLEIKP